MQWFIQFRFSSVMLQAHRTSNTSAMTLLLRVSKCLGLVGFTRNQGPSACGKSVVAIATVVVNFLFTAALAFMDLHNLEFEVLCVSEMLTVVSKTISHVTVIILCFCNEVNIYKITKNLQELSDQLVTDYVYTKTIPVTAQLCLGITVILLSNTFEWFHMGESLISLPRHVLYTFTDFSVYVIELQFINFVLFVKQCFANINTKLGNVKFRAKSTTQLTTVYPPATLRSIEYLQAFHDTLCDITQLLNCVYSPIILIDVGFSLFRSTQKLFRIIFSNLGRKSAIPCFQLLVDKCFHWIKLIFIINACGLCSNNVSRSCKRMCVCVCRYLT
jgi:hypothetical protein